MMVRARRIRGEFWRRRNCLYDTAHDVYRQSSLKAAILAGLTCFTAGCSTAPIDGPGRADYLAGLSAYDRGDNEQARLRLTAAVTELHGEDAAKARAALGLVELARDRPAKAAEAFAVAWPALRGEDARQAARFAAAAYQQLADDDAAALWSRRAIPHEDRPRPRRRGSFTIQVGAFRERGRAERAAVDAAEVAQETGFGPVRIVTRSDRRGIALYVVQLGSFGTRTEAASARERVGKLQYIVAAQQPG